MAGMAELVYTTPLFWLGILLVPIVALVPDVIYSAVKMTAWPSETDKFRLAEKIHASQVPSEGSSLLGRMRFWNSKSTGRRDTPEIELGASGFAFSQDENSDPARISQSYGAAAGRSAKKKSGRSPTGKQRVSPPK